MELYYTYWYDRNGWYLGYLNDWPDQWTQGRSVAELEGMLADLYEMLKAETRKEIPERKTGKLIVAADEKRCFA